MHLVRYALEEALTSLWRGRQSGALSTGVIALALFVLGGALLLTSNLERLGSEWSRAAELSVYLHDGVADPDRAAIERLLRGHDLVAGFEHVSREEAARRFKATFAELSGTIDALEANPLPASYEVRLRPAGTDALDRLAAALRQSPGVDDVRYDRQWLDRLASAVTVVRGVGLALGAVLTLAAGLTVANVVRLALHARRDELEIMQLVGAPRSYIRGPFLVEGVLQGGVGATLALAALAALFVAARGRYLLPLAQAVNLSGVAFLSPGVCLTLVAGGMVVGCLGGLVAALGRT
jgi:cell division transport system permease protein